MSFKDSYRAQLEPALMRLLPFLHWWPRVNRVTLRSDAIAGANGAVVGPETRCQLEPKRAATIAGTIAAYRPYSGGIPAIVAKATPCGSTMTAPIAPAVKSARLVTRCTRGHHLRNGSSRVTCGGRRASSDDFNRVTRMGRAFAFDYRAMASAAAMRPAPFWV